MTICLVGTEAEVIAANTQIENAMGVPYGITTGWDTPTQIYEISNYYIVSPEQDAIYNGHTGAELMEAVTAQVTQEEYSPDWRPPSSEMEND